MNKEELVFQKRLVDLATMADRRGIVLFSDFLNLNELNIYHSSQKDLSFVECRLFGGYEAAERQMIAFIPDALSYDFEYPFLCIEITPMYAKYAEKLTHRDYLGAILNLGIERSKIGDILLCEDCAYVFCQEKMADLLCQELTRIRHTLVTCRQIPLLEFHYEQRFTLIHGTIASERLDALLSLAFSSSRSGLTGLIEGGKVFVNGKLVTSNGYHPKEGDVISVRGYGKFQYGGASFTTKKGRLAVDIKKYS